MASDVPTVEKQRRARVREKFPTTPDPIEIAMAAAASGKPLPGAALNVLEKHAKLIDRQAELAHAQCGELRLRRVGEGVRAALWAILAFAALAVVGLVAAVIVRAARADALVVQSFRVPPALASRGLTGEVVATHVLDKVAEMQKRTDSVRAASSYANNWEDDLKIDIPNTGATTSEVWRLLRSWLGKETRISGEVTSDGSSLALTARIGSSPGERFESPTADLDALIKSGAELIFRQTQPYRHAIFMARDGREAERYALLRQLTAHESPIERKWAYSGLSYDMNSRGQFKASVLMADRALAIDSRMAPARSNQSRAFQALGLSQRALDGYRQSFSQMSSDEYDPKVAAVNKCGLLDDIGTLSNDPFMLDEAARCSEEANALELNGPALSRARAAQMRNDFGPSLRLKLEISEIWPGDLTRYIEARERLSAHSQQGRSPLLAEALNAYRNAAKVIVSTGPYAASYRAAAPAEDWPLEVRGLLMLGLVDEARSLIGRTPSNCYECVRMRGLTEQAAGNLTAARSWFTEAVRQGPGLAPAYVDLGRLLAQQGRYLDAEANFIRAARIAPKWADPLKYWGDALVAQGKGSEARVRYDAARKLAPAWRSLGSQNGRANR